MREDKRKLGEGQHQRFSGDGHKAGWPGTGLNSQPLGVCNDVTASAHGRVRLYEVDPKPRAWLRRRSEVVLGWSIT